MAGQPCEPRPAKGNLSYTARSSLRLTLSAFAEDIVPSIQLSHWVWTDPKSTGIPQGSISISLDQNPENRLCIAWRTGGKLCRAVSVGWLSVHLDEFHLQQGTFVEQ